ncbi:MAG: tRNA pseudouridine(38-40) synthase TruA, partial [Candidatus Caldatribacteriaceae bacterium]
MRNFLLVLEYDGSEYSGWQIQKGKKTIQGTLEKILSDTLGETIKVYASGRTDAGVHALGQVVNFWTISSFYEETILRIIRSQLPKDIKVKNFFEVPPDFHARKDAFWKRYLYVI